MTNFYTEKIIEGCTFEEFLWNSVGAISLVGLHYASNTIPIKYKISYSDFLSQLNLLIDEINNISCLSNDDLEQVIKKEHEEYLLRRKESLEKSSKNKQYLQAMLDSIESFNRKNLVEEKLKEFFPLVNFMRERVLDSLNFELNDDDLSVGALSSPEEWKKEKLDFLIRRVQYLVSDHSKAMKNINESQKYIEKLDSIVPIPSTFTKITYEVKL